MARACEFVLCLGLIARGLSLRHLTSPRSSSAGTPTATNNVQPLSTLPPNLPPLNTGIFSLPRLTASQAPSDCVNHTTQTQAWSCETPFDQYLFEIAEIPNQAPVSKYSLKLTTPLVDFSLFSSLSLGDRPPIIADPMTLILVNNTFEPQRGLAWWIVTRFDKTVVLKTGSFSASGVSPSKRGWGSPDDDSFNRRDLLGPEHGPNPWICTWPDTILEVFIYPTQENHFKAPPSGTAWPSSGPGGVTTGMPQSTATASSGPGPSSPDALPLYPLVINFVEHRTPGSGNTTASCRQFRVTNDGERFQPVLKANGDPVEFVIVEKEQNPPPNAGGTPWIDSKHVVYDLATNPLRGCGCMWSLA